MEESTKTTKVITRRSSEYTVNESMESVVTLTRKPQEAAGTVQPQSEVRGAPVGSSDVNTVVEGRPYNMKPVGQEALARPLDQSKDDRDVSVLSEEVVAEHTEAVEQGDVDLSDLDQEDEELFALEQEREAQVSGEVTAPNEECLFDELGPDSAAEMDEAVELSSEMACSNLTFMCHHWSCPRGEFGDSAAS